MLQLVIKARAPATVGVGSTDFSAIRTTNETRDCRREHPTPVHGDALFQHQSALLIRNAAATLYQLNDSVWRNKVQTLGRGRLQVSLQELALPAVAVYEGHVHPVTVVWRHAVQVGRIRSEICPPASALPIFRHCGRLYGGDSVGSVLIWIRALVLALTVLVIFIGNPDALNAENRIPFIVFEGN